MHINFNNVIDDPFVGFESKRELVLVENFMGEAISGGRLGEWNGKRGRREGGVGSGSLVDEDGVGKLLVLVSVADRVMERVWGRQGGGGR